MLDTVREIHTPEGVALRLPAAGPAPRAIAWAIDFGLRMGIVFVVAGFLSLGGAAGNGVYAIVLFGLFWLYPIVCEGFWNGQTPGKRIMSLRVVSSDGAPVGWLASFIRNLLRVVDMLPAGYATGLIVGLCDPWGRRLGDHVARTMVIHEAPEGRAGVLPAVDPCASVVPLRPAEQAAVVAFAERAPLLTPERQVELADIAEGATGARGELGVRRLSGIANWLLGRA